MDAPGTKDAVLVPLDLRAVFTERRADLRRHAGEISFPGGRQDHPEEDLRATALREAHEESGSTRQTSSWSARCRPSARSSPATGSSLSWDASRRAVWTPQESEVERVLEFSLTDLVRGHEMRRLVRKGVPIKTPTYTVEGHLVWGATADRAVAPERLTPLI